MNIHSSLVDPRMICSTTKLADAVTAVWVTLRDSIVCSFVVPSPIWGGSSICNSYPYSMGSPPSSSKKKSSARNLTSRMSGFCEEEITWGSSNYSLKVKSFDSYVLIVQLKAKFLSLSDYSRILSSKSSSLMAFQPFETSSDVELKGLKLSKWAYSLALL